jgi:hypothetical protein
MLLAVRIVALILISSGLYTASYMLCNLLFKKMDGVLKTLYAFVISIFYIYTVVFLLGLFEILYFGTLLLLTSPPSLYLLYRGSLSLFTKRKNIGPMTLARLSLYLKERWKILCVGLDDAFDITLFKLSLIAITIFMTLLFLFALKAPIGTNDMSFYHLPYVDNIIRNHSINHVYHQFPRNNIIAFSAYMAGYPRAYEFLLAYVVLFLGKMSFLKLFGFFFLSMSMLAVYRYVKIFIPGEGKLYNFLAVNAVLSMPIIYINLEDNNVDTMMLFLHILIPLILLQAREEIKGSYNHRRIMSHFLILSLVLGLDFATKFFSIVEASAIVIFSFVFFIVPLWRREFGKIVASVGLVAIISFLSSCFFYIKNYIVFKNPFYPYAMGKLYGPVNADGQYWLERILVVTGTNVGLAHNYIKILFKAYIYDSFMESYWLKSGTGTLGALYVLLIPFAVYTLWRFRRLNFIRATLLALPIFILAKLHVLWMLRYNLYYIFLLLIIAFYFFKAFAKKSQLTKLTLLILSIGFSLMPVYLLKFNISDNSHSGAVNYLRYVATIATRPHPEKLSSDYLLEQKIQRYYKNRVLIFYQNQDYNVQMYSGYSFSRELYAKDLNDFKVKKPGEEVYNTEKLYNYMKSNKIDAVVTVDHSIEMKRIQKCRKMSLAKEKANPECFYVFLSDHNFSSTAKLRYGYVLESAVLESQLAKDPHFKRLYQFSYSYLLYGLSS